MERREFLGGSVLAGVVAATGSTSDGASAASNSGKFKLKYAPKLTAFKGLVGSSDAIENIKFCADQGFRAVFDNGVGRRPAAEQEAIANELARLGMDLGPFVASGVPDFSSTDQAVRDAIKTSLEDSIEVVKRTGAKWVLLVPGAINLKMEPAYQTANVIDNCRYCCEVLEKSAPGPRGLDPKERAEAKAIGGWIEYSVDPSREVRDQMAFGLQGAYKKSRKSKDPQSDSSWFDDLSLWDESTTSSDGGRSPMGGTRPFAVPETEFGTDLFDETDGLTVTDVSGVGTALDLTVEDPDRVTFDEDGMSIDLASRLLGGEVGDRANNGAVLRTGRLRNVRVRGLLFEARQVFTRQFLFAQLTVGLCQRVMYLAGFGIDAQCLAQVRLSALVIMPEQVDLTEIIQGGGAQPALVRRFLQRGVGLVQLVGVQPQLSHAQVKGTIVRVEFAGLLEQLQGFFGLTTVEGQVAGVIGPTEIRRLQRTGVFPAQRGSAIDMEQLVKGCQLTVAFCQVFIVVCAALQQLGQAVAGPGDRFPGDAFRTRDVGFGNRLQPVLPGGREPGQRIGRQGLGQDKHQQADK